MNKKAILCLALLGATTTAKPWFLPTFTTLPSVKVILGATLFGGVAGFAARSITPWPSTKIILGATLLGGLAGAIVHLLNRHTTQELKRFIAQQLTELRAYFDRRFSEHETDMRQQFAISQQNNLRLEEKIDHQTQLMLNLQPNQQDRQKRKQLLSPAESTIRQ